MRVTSKLVADQLGAYLHQEMALEQLVDWAETEVMEGEFESQAVRDVVARLGLADVRAFGLTWEDCQQLLHDLGYSAQVQIETA